MTGEAAGTQRLPELKAPGERLSGGSWLCPIISGARGTSAGSGTAAGMCGGCGFQRLPAVVSSKGRIESAAIQSSFDEPGTC